MGKREMLDSLQHGRMELRGNAPLCSFDADDAGALRWRGSATVSVTTEDGDGTGFPDWSASPEAAFDRTPDDYQLDLEIFRAEGLIIDLGKVDYLVDALDGASFASGISQLSEPVSSASRVGWGAYP